MEHEYIGKKKILVKNTEYLLRCNNKTTFDGKRTCTDETIIKRAHCIKSSLIFLYDSGFKIIKPERFRLKHAKF